MNNSLSQLLEHWKSTKPSAPALEKQILALFRESPAALAELPHIISQLDYLTAAELRHLRLFILELQNDTDKTVIINNDDKTIIAGQADDDKTIIATALDADEDKTQLAASSDNVDDNKTRVVPSVDLDKTELSSFDNDKTQVTPSFTGTASTTSLQPGGIINNRFELIKLLGRGGMGTVYKAKDRRKEEAKDSNPYIAIKFLNDDFKQHPQSLVSLQRECKKSQTLAHPNIITVHDFDRDGDIVYMTMELMDGEPLDELLRKHKATGLEFSLAYNILKDVSQALAYAHEKNLVHSDFKPGNIFVTNDGRAKVLDFGIARAVKVSGDNVDSDSTVFDAGDLGGLTPAYASCEMIEGQTPSPADDIYALGCVAYELFTGTHPFGKLQADKARDKHLSVAPLKQLERKQATALLNTLKFDREQRTANAQQFVAEFFEKKQTSKGLLASLAIAALLLAGVGVKLFFDFQDQQSINELITTINQGDAQTIANTLPRVGQLNESVREAVLQEVRESVIDFYTAQALPMVDQNRGKYDFPRAISILQSAQSFYPDSAKIKELIDQLQSRKNQLLNTLASQLNDYATTANLHSSATTDDIKAVFDLIKVIDPQSKLLSDQRLQLSYVREIKNALAVENLSKAEKLVNNGLSLFPVSKDLGNLSALLQEQKQQVIEDQKLAELQKKLSKEGATISAATRSKAISRHKEKLQALLEQPFSQSSWMNQVKAESMSLKIFLSKPDKAADSLFAQAAKLIVAQAKSERRDNKLDQARRLLNVANDINPRDSQLAKEKRALAVAERQQRAEQASMERSERINALQQTLLTQANANDVNAAENSYQALKKLQPNSRFVSTQAPEAIGDAYIRLADGLAKRGSYDQAASLIGAGLKIAPHYSLLQTANERYTAEIAFNDLNQLFKDLRLENANDIEAKLNLLRKGLPNNIKEKRSKLAETLLASLKQASQNNQAEAKQYAHFAQQLFPENSAIAELTKRSSKFQATGGQLCKHSYAGHGNRTRATCYDVLSNNNKAPLLVVIPALNASGAPFAVSKYEISIADFNLYCTQTQTCSASNTAEQELPLVNVSIEQAQQYTQWLSRETQSTYRLPSSAEWHHAAHAQGDQPKKDFNCRLMLGNKQIKGLNLVNVQSGNQNGWGLKNYVGNVQEFSLDNGKVYAHGGAYSDAFSQCDVTLKRNHNGQADSITGFRIVKEL